MRVCSICSHPQRPEIDRALLASEPERAIAGRYGVSRAALGRHRAHIAAAVQAQQAMTVERLLCDLADLQQRALALLAKAEDAGDLRAALAAVREVRGVIETGAKLIETSELRKRVEDLERIVSERSTPS
jgi:hypothetical protein